MSPTTKSRRWLLGGKVSSTKLFVEEAAACTSRYPLSVRSAIIPNSRIISRVQSLVGVSSVQRPKLHHCPDFGQVWFRDTTTTTPGSSRDLKLPWENISLRVWEIWIIFVDNFNRDFLKKIYRRQLEGWGGKFRDENSARNSRSTAGGGRRRRRRNRARNWIIPG